MPLNPPLRDWTGQVVWMVGASSGIGLALAERLALAGARVAVSARSSGPLEAFARLHPGAIALPCDLTLRESVLGATQTLLEACGRLDMVVACAGHYRAQRATDFDLDEALRHVQVNHIGVLHLLDAVLPQLLAQGQGHLSLVASVAGYRGLPQALAYGPTKAALINLAQCLYLDLQPRGLGVSVVNPGFVRTPLTAQNTFRMPALITPEAAAEATLAGWARGAFEIHYPRRFTQVLRAMRWLPDAAYFALVRRATGL